MPAVTREVSVYRQTVVFAMEIKVREDRDTKQPARKCYRLSIVVQSAGNSHGDFSGEERDTDNPRVSG